MYPGQARLSIFSHKRFCFFSSGKFHYIIFRLFAPFYIFCSLLGLLLVRCSVILYFSLSLFLICPLWFLIYWKTSPILSSSSSLYHILAIFLFFKFPQAPFVFSNHSFLFFFWLYEYLLDFSKNKN